MANELSIGRSLGQGARVGFETPKVEWFIGGKTKRRYNCLDRHLTDGRRNKAAIIWESDEGRSKIYTYQSLYYRCAVRQCAQEARHQEGRPRRDLHADDPELAIAMLGCARIGAIHSIVFGGFSPNSLRDRIQDSGCKMLVTADEGVRGGRLSAQGHG